MVYCPIFFIDELVPEASEFGDTIPNSEQFR
jgi:hypothetical protein